MQEITIRGLTFSKLTLGTVQLGLPYGIANKRGMPDETTSAAILETALKGSISCLDTANVYGTSEQVLGHFFENRMKPLIVTKIRVDAEASTTEADIERVIFTNVESSLRNLKMSRLPVVMIHNPQVLALHGPSVTRAAKKLVQEGLVDKMGVSLNCHSKEQFDDLWLTLANDIYETVQIPINIFDTKLLTYGGLKRLEDAGKVVFARSVFLQGLLFMQERELPAHLRDAAEPLRILHTIAEQENMSVAQLAMSFIRDLPQIHSIVFGAETPEQVEDNLQLYSGRSISEAAQEKILKSFVDIPEHIVNPALWVGAMKTSS